LSHGLAEAEASALRAGYTGMIEVTSEIEARIRAGERLDEEMLRHIESLDVLTLGMLADGARRRLHGTEATFVRVFDADVSNGWTIASLPEAACEVRLAGLPATLNDAAEAVQAARHAAGDRVLSGFNLADLIERVDTGWGDLALVLTSLKAAGLDTLAEAPIDRLHADGAWLSVVRDADMSLSRLTVDRVLGPDRVATLLAIRRLQESGAGLRAIAPLPRIQPVATPTTGYDDVRAVALARLALDNVPSIQVDWQQFGPKLAQVALTFGADDLDRIAADEDLSKGWRRAPVEEIRRNIESAGLQAVERDGRYEKVRESGGGRA
jgi:aminodeoxyfutalosine synthase